MDPRTSRFGGDAGGGTAPSLSSVITERLAPFLGAFNAQVWVKTVAERKLGLSPEDLKPEHLDALVEGLRPSLNTFMGRAAAEDLLRQIGREVG
ncbi:MAG: hypothetical protein ACLF0P_09630 [Thermoanaerobaculia bacterium]